MEQSLRMELIESGKANTDVFWKHLEALVHHGIISPAEMHYMMGLACGYNLCCIKNFLNMKALGIPPAGFMSIVLGQENEADHVLCPMCHEKWQAENPFLKLPKTRFGEPGTNRSVDSEKFIRDYAPM